MAPEQQRGLEVRDTARVVVHRAAVSLDASDGLHRIVIALDDERSYEAASDVDYEDALDRIRTLLEAESLLLLLCNRFRIDAFVSSMVRQMTDGLGCYLVEERRPVSPDQIVESLAQAPAEMVSTRADNEAFLHGWIAGFD